MSKHLQELPASPPSLPHSTLFSSFPQTPEEFSADPRISFSKVEQKWLLETADGSEYEYDTAFARWLPVLDAALLEQQARVYAVEGVDESAAVVTAASKKRKGAEFTNDFARSSSADGNEAAANGSKEANGRAKRSKKSSTDPLPPRKNTAVYVTGLPSDATVAEIQTLFSRCGVIAEEIDTGRPRIKLYLDATGAAKGDALIVYFRAESVALAEQMLDDTDFRFGEAGPHGKMRVQVAESSYKKVQGPDGTTPQGKASAAARDKQKIIKKTQKLNNRLADWGDDTSASLSASLLVESPPPRPRPVPTTVILKHMFTLAELAADAGAQAEIGDDIRDECEKLGAVRGVVVYDREPEGIAAVEFADEAAAQRCVGLMHERFFAGAKVEAFIATGAESFRRSGEGEGEGGGATEDAEEKRLAAFGEWLEGGGGEGAS
ncbi:MAG: hypothetical protein M1829_003083 [Trizodia sp. TS-e1964]|nr:MAG: hypothetical protein M1829_003083 [Trizodia sp. TS-e1964]